MSVVWLLSAALLPCRIVAHHVQGFGYRPVDGLSASGDGRCPMCRVSDTGPLMIYPPVVMAGVRKPSGKEPAGGGVGGLLSMGICRGSVLGRGCTGRRNGRRTDDQGSGFCRRAGRW